MPVENRQLGSSVTLLRQRFEQIRIRQAKFSGLRTALETREKELTRKVALAKGRLALAEEADAALEGMQQIVHQRSVGVFEELLSAILSDALPESGPVKLELGTERGLPALDVSVQNGENLEDVLTGSGGAATNLLVAGLRFSALCRTNNRRFIVLDEPDCWLKPEHIPAFIKVLTGVAKQVETQVIFVSHHDPSFFEGAVDMVKFNYVDRLTTEVQPIEPHVHAWQDNATPGIRSLRLINFRKFADVSIPLSPGITAFIGDNNLGKSHAAVGALHAVAYGDSTDKDIRHGEEEAKVVITLEDDFRIEWTRKRKGSPKVTYALFQGDKEIHNGPPPGRGQIPPWLIERLGIARACDLDVQLHSQKKPVFLLDEPASVRAQLLSVGRESERLHTLIERYGNAKRKDRETVREGEAEIALLRSRIAGSESITGMGDSIKELSVRLTDIEQHSAKMSAIGKLLARAEGVISRQRKFTAQLAVLGRLPKPPMLQNTQLIAGILRKLERASKIASLKCEYRRVTVPVLHDLRRIAELGARLAKLQTRAGIKLPTTRPQAPPALRSTDSIKRIGVLLSSRITASEQAREALTRAKNELNEASEELSSTIGSLGGVCPTCRGPLPQDFKGDSHVHLQKGAV